MTQSDENLVQDFVSWLRNKFPLLRFEIKKSLKELFPKPRKKSLQYFWNCKGSHADISAFRHGKLVCIIEPGGWQHLTDKRQRMNDERKEAICKKNGVSFLSLMNSCMEFREMNQFRRMLKCVFYKK